MTCCIAFSVAQEQPNNFPIAVFERENIIAYVLVEYEDNVRAKTLESSSLIFGIANMSILMYRFVSSPLTRGGGSTTYINFGRIFSIRAFSTGRIFFCKAHRDNVLFLEIHDRKYRYFTLE